jgi:hypothetical protein
VLLAHAGVAGAADDVVGEVEGGEGRAARGGGEEGGGACVWCEFVSV